MANLLLFIALTLALALLCNLALSTLRLGISPTPSNPAMRKASLELLKQQLQDQKNTDQTTQILYIAGSGWGGLTFDIAKAFPEHSVIGYEGALTPWLVSQVQLRCRRALSSRYQNVSLQKTRFANSDFTEGSVVITYLYPQGTQKLYHQITNLHAPPKAMMSLAFAVDHIPPAHMVAAQDLWRTPIYWYWT